MPSPSLARFPPRSLLEVVCPLARSSFGRSHAWLVRKPDLVWQILTDFLGGRADGRTGNPSRSSFKRALRKGISAPPPPTRTNEPRSQVSYRRYFARSSAAEGALLFGLMRLVGMQISSLSCRLFADGPTDARSEREKGSGKKDHPSGSGREGEPSSRLGFTGKSGGGVLRFLPLSRVPLFGSFYASAPWPWPRRHRLEWRRREQKEARSTAVKWGLATGDRRERRGTLELVGFGQRKDSVSLAASFSSFSSRPLSATHRNLSPP